MSLRVNTSPAKTAPIRPLTVTTPPAPTPKATSVAAQIINQTSIPAQRPNLASRIHAPTPQRPIPQYIDPQYVEEIMDDDEEIPVAAAPSPIANQTQECSVEAILVQCETLRLHILERMETELSCFDVDEAIHITNKINEQENISINNPNFTYTGQLVNGKAQGLGKVVNTDGSTYEGQWCEGNKHGVGIERYPSGHTYFGEWKEGLRSGIGTYIYSNETRYQGEWQQGKRHGEGILYSTVNVTYIGEYQEDKKHGKGVSIWPCGDSHVGEYQNNQLHGKGSYIYVNGDDSYIGEFKEHKKHGKGVYIFANGEIYKGDWHQNQRHGQGRFTKNGVIYQGIWQNDRCISQSAVQPPQEQSPALSNEEISQLSVEVLQTNSLIINRFRNSNRFREEDLHQIRDQFALFLTCVSPKFAAIFTSTYQEELSSFTINLLKAATLQNPPTASLASAVQALNRYPQCTTDEARARALDDYWSNFLVPRAPTTEADLRRIAPTRDADFTSGIVRRIRGYSSPQDAFVASILPPPRPDDTSLQVLRSLARGATPLAIGLGGPLGAGIAGMVNGILDLASLFI